MSQRRFGTGVLILAALLVFPRSGSAGIAEIILEMSGPRMLGFGLECRLVFSGTQESCKRRSPATDLIFAENQPDAKVWVSVSGAFYFSLGQTVNEQPYETGEVKMWSFDPMLEIESKAWRLNGKNVRLQIYHGVLGVSYNLLHGDRFPTFSNVGLRLRPAGIVIPFSETWGIDFSYNLRLYPRAFTAADFGKDPVPGVAEPGPGAEAVQSFVIGLRRRI
jgi:hypothetical protein